MITILSIIIIMYNNATVRIGNWIEDIEVEKEKTWAFIKKRQQEKLLVQRTRRLLHNLLRETQLSESNDDDDFVKFGNCVQIKAPDMPNSRPCFIPTTALGSSENVNTTNDNYSVSEPADRTGVFVAATIHDKYIGDDTISGLVNGCQLIASPTVIPCVRNSFIIKSADDTNRTGHNLLFGQEFVLQIVDSLRGEALYVRAETPLVDGPHGPLDHNPVQLSNKKDCYSTWKVLHWDKEMRFESEGAPFTPFTRVVLRHSMSGLNLAVEGTVWWQSIFGNECGLSVHTYVNSIKRETAECLWMFIMHQLNSSN